MTLSILGQGGNVDTGRFLHVVTFQGYNLTSQVNDYMMPSVSQAPPRGLLKPHSNIGGLISRPYHSLEEIVDVAMRDPYEFAWICWGWGDNLEFQANALRKELGMIEAYLETGRMRSTFELVLDEYDFPHRVPAVDHGGHYPVGIFPFGGAMVVQYGKLLFVTSVSALTQIEDGAPAGAAAMFAGSQLYKFTPPGEDPIGLLQAA